MAEKANEVTTENSGRFMEIGGETIDLAAKGKAQITRLTKMSTFIDRYGKTAIKSLNFDDLDEAGRVNAIDLIINFVGGLNDEDAFIMLGQIVTGKDAEFVEENFDLEWVTDGITWLLGQGPFRKLLERFFSNRG